MRWNVFAIIFLMLISGFETPLWAENAKTPQKSQANASQSEETSLNNENLKKQETFKIYPSCFNVWGSDICGISQSSCIRIHSGCSPLVVESTNRTPMGISDNRKNLEEIYTASQKEINYLLRFVGFGILIAIFSMTASFRTQHRGLVLCASGLASFSLILNYVGCNFQSITSKNLLSRNDSLYEYSWMIGVGDCLFTLIQIILVGAVLSFGFLAYKYFFYREKK